MSLTTTPQAATADPAPERTLAPMPKHWKSLARVFVHSARRKPKSPCFSDSTGTKLSYGETFLRAAALSRVLARTLGPGAYVGVMIPPTVHGAMANLALALLGKVVVNLNYTGGQAIIDSSIDQCGITRVLTSRRVLDKFKIKPKGELIFLEDVPKQVTTADKVFAAMAAKVVPIAALGALFPGLRNESPDATATVIFTSGSTGDPKGVVLSHRNVLVNIHQFKQQVELSDDEVILGVLPFFHSFGYTVSIWGTLSLGFAAAYHFSPLDARVIGNLCQESKSTILLCTPTFLLGYLKRCDAEQFATMRLPILGAEKLKPEVAAQIRQTLKIEPLEGYGCTELSPVVAVNTPNPLTTGDGRSVPGNRPGTVGMPLPGTAIKTVDPASGADLPRVGGIDPRQRPAGHGRLFEQARGHGQGDPRRMVQHGRPRPPRRRRLPEHHRTAQPVLEDRRRDGASRGRRIGPDRRLGRGQPRRADPRRDLGSRPQASGAPDRRPHSRGLVSLRPLPRACRRPVAEIMAAVP